MVLDPFMGGGTTAVACARTNRRCVGIELDTGHVALAENRIRNEVGSRVALQPLAKH